ncbi:MAG: TIGR00730 family Rossman fold protein [Rhodospirillales bacterium]|nr:MAG: TIGR00730 family Rossman fold protein [Rhodospirillales bacterium]
MAEVRALCALCGSREGADSLYREATIRLGVLMAARGMQLVYGGGAVGLMGVLADAVIAAGGRVVGVIPDFLMQKEVGHRRLSDLLITGSMQDRKTRMFEMSDGFIILPGGLGTLDEAFEIITWKQLGLHDAPIVVLNVGSYWDPLIALIGGVIQGGFANRSAADLVTVVDSPDAVFPALEAAPPAARPVLTSHL